MAELAELELERIRDLARNRSDATPLPPQLLDKLLHLDAAAPQPLPERIGSYRILAERGRGGMGVVYEAMDEILGRRVAVKVLASGRYADSKARDRFHREARAAAGMQHENLVPVFATEAPDDGPPYLVMPFIDGPTLGDLIATRRMLEPRVAAELIRQVASGVQALHAAGFIHRDIKPGNILLAPMAETFVPKLTDFGLAREEHRAAMTTAGTIAGTPSYLSPEQIHSPDAIDVRVDVYALGATLYECLTGVPPFRGATLDVLRMIGENEPVHPRALNRDVPRDLETICVKCLAKKPEKRYASAVELQNDLDRYLANEPILARPAGPIERSLRWVQRNPWAAAVVFVSVVGAVTSGLGWQRAAMKTADAEGARDDARTAAELATKSRTQSDERAVIALGTINAMVTKAQRISDRTPATLMLKKELAEIAIADLKKLVSIERIGGADLTLIRAHDELGQIYQSLGRFNEARQQLDSGLEAIRNLSAADGATVEVYGLTAGMHYILNKIDSAELKSADAFAHATASVAAIERARALDPTSYDVARRTAVYYNGRADTYWNQFGNTRAALADFRKALAICEGLLPMNSGLNQLHRDLGFTEDRIARLHSARFEFVEAETHSLAARRYAEQALVLDPLNATNQRAARIAVLDRGFILNNAGAYADAERLVRPMLPQLAAIAKAEPENLILRRDLAIGHSMLGETLAGLGRLDEAAEVYELSLAQRESLGVFAVKDLAETGRNLINIEVRRHRYDRVVPLCERMIRASEQMEKLNGPAPYHDAYRKTLRQSIQVAPLMAGAIADPATLAHQPPELRAFIARILALDLVRLGRGAEARTVLSHYPGEAADAEGWYQLSMIVHTISASQAVTPAEREEHLAKAYTFAVKLFGIPNQTPTYLLNVPELLPLRAYPPFQKLVASMN